MTGSEHFVVAYERLDLGRLLLVGVVIALGAAVILGMLVCNFRRAVAAWRTRRQLDVGGLLGSVVGACLFGLLMRQPIGEILGGDSVEGPVREFTQTESHGQLDLIRFAVCGAHFEYYNYRGRNSAITQLGSSGEGPLRNGIYLRIKYRNGVILKVEVLN